MLTLRSLKQTFDKRHSALRLGLEIGGDSRFWALQDARGELYTGPLSQDEPLEALVAARGLTGAPTRVVLGQDDYRVFQVERPAVEEQELAEAMRWKLGELLDYPASEAVIDTFPFPEDASRDRGPLVNVVCAHEARIRAVVDAVHGAGLSLECIDIAELALRNLLASGDHDERGAALVYLGPDNGQMVFCRGDTLYMARRLGVSLARLRDAATQEQTVQALALEIQRSLDYYESQLRQIPPSRIQLAGHPEALPLAGMLNSEVTAQVVDLDWDVVRSGWAAEPGAGLAAAALLAERESVA